jgi:CDP-diacylglycerol--glycerol-3-phosphate 3-phosphatidyltransferase
VNLPNAITVARLLVTVLVFVCLETMSALQPDHAQGYLALGLFLFAACTDFLDGYFARKYGQVTAFGRVADPFADKVLTCGSFVCLLRFPAATEILTSWYVTAIRGLVEASGRPFPADRLGKWKMVAQCWTAAALISMVAGTRIWVWAAQWGFWVSLVLTVVSGVNYVWKGRDVLFAK